MAWVYILKSAKGRYYIGSTTDLESRVRHHQGGYTPSTKKLGSVLLVFSQQYDSLGDARKVETKLKRLKRKDYIEKIIKDGIIRTRV